jgi:hypothetical protein
MMPPSACLPWQTDTPGQTAEERNEGARSYTTVRGTIARVASKRTLRRLGLLELL